MFGAPAPDSPWAKMVADLGCAVKFLADEKDIPVKRVGLVGASLGANVCMIYASLNEDIPVTVLLSPGLNYAGLGTLDVVGAFKKRRLVFVASPGDTYAFQSVQLLFQRVHNNPRAVRIETAGGHGVQMFDGNLENKLLKYFAQ
jgi:dienelactone hydrolase